VNARRSTLCCARGPRAPDAAPVLAPARAPLTYRRCCFRSRPRRRASPRWDWGGAAAHRHLAPQRPEAAVSFLAIASSAHHRAVESHLARGWSYEPHSSEARESRPLVLQEGRTSPAVSRRSRPRHPGDPPDASARRPRRGCSRSRAFGTSGHGPGSPPTTTNRAGPSTSGTTSTPRVVLLSQANVWRRGPQRQRGAPARPADAAQRHAAVPHSRVVGAVLSSITSERASSARRGTSRRDSRSGSSSLARPGTPRFRRSIRRSSLCGDGSRRLSSSRLRFIRSCSAPLPAKIARDLEECFACRSSKRMG